MIASVSMRSQSTLAPERPKESSFTAKTTPGANWCKLKPLIRALHAMNTHLDQAPPPQRQKQKPQKATAPMPQLGRHRVEPRPVATHPPSPPRRPILWREAPKLWRDEKPPKKKKKKENEAAAISAREMAGAKINQKELAHLLQFLLCQLRWQAGKIVDESFDAFDEEMRRIDTQSPDDVASCQQLMAKFLDGPASGDRWVPWHTVTCEMELFLMTSLRTAPDLDDKEKFVLATAFSGSRWCPLFRSAVYPYFSRALDTENAYEGEERRGSRILDPDAAFVEGGDLYEKVVQWRDRGFKLHTKAFNSYPQRGEGGERYPAYICRRMAHFAKIGLAAWPSVVAGKCTMRSLDTLYRGFYRIGPTMSKVLLVTNHLWRPELKILDESCEVGDGADEAFNYLFGARGGGDAVRKRRLKALFDHLAAQDVEPRLKPMAAWVAARTRARFPSVPAGAISDALTIYDLQVQLCEWRKFRKRIDKKRTIARGVVL